MTEGPGFEPTTTADMEPTADRDVSAAPPDARRHWVRDVVVGALVVLALAAVVMGGVAVQGLRAERALRVAVAAADDHYAQAVRIVAAVEPKVAGASLKDPTTIGSDVASLTASAADDIQRAQGEISKARTALAGVRDPAVRTAYLGACGEVGQGLVAMLGMLDYLGRSGGVLQHVLDAISDFGTADRLVNEAIMLGNRARWKEAGAKAAAAVSLFRKAEAGLDTGAREDPAAGLGDASAYVATYRAAAQGVVRMVALGAKGDVAGYNRLSDRVNAARAAADKAATPSAITDPGWSEQRLAVFEGEVTRHMAKADALTARVQTLLAQRVRR